MSTVLPVQVSIIIPCYNYARFLADAVASVLAQTFTDWELIVVDDGSSDATLATARQLLEQHSDRRIRVLHQSNQGNPATRNTGAQRALGEYMMYLDADDLIAPTYLERTVAILRDQPAVGFVYTGMRLFGDDRHDWPSTAYDSRILPIENAVLSHALLRRVAWEQVGGFDTIHPLYGLEDWDFWLRLAAAGWQGWHVDQLLVFYRRHARSMSSQLRRDQEWDARAQIIRKHPQLYGRRLVAWATVRCVRRGAPVLAQPAIGAQLVEELEPLAHESTRRFADATNDDRRSRNGSTADVVLADDRAIHIPLARRLIRIVPFDVRFRVKCWRRRAQLGLRAAFPWLYF
ncbi:MAG: glycosyltransferase [Roseiflexaceae bacterium]